MEFCSYFIKNKCLFGTYPSQINVEELEVNNIKHFVNLTHNDEKLIKPYTTKYNYYSYPIYDNSVPTDWFTFSKFLYKIVNIIYKLNNDEKMYVHCRGGHGRSIIFIICILVIYHDITIDISIKMVNHYHQQRKNLKEKWKNIVIPNIYKQKKFLENFFKPLYYYKALKDNITTGFSNFSLHSVYIKELGVFPTSEAAFNAYKNLNNIDYVIKQLKSKTPIISRKISYNVIPTEYWNKNKLVIMKYILKCKVEQHEEVKNNLINTGCRQIIFNDKNDNFWGIGPDNLGLNNIGKILMEIRNEIYLL
jgi:ribA/ribD-fused uncharacterized protein